LKNPANAEHPVSEEFLELLWRDGVLRSADAKLTPLTDGVSSEILRVDDGEDSFVVKRALPRLRVRDHWTANVDRNNYEKKYIEYVARFLPANVPALRPGPVNRGYFAMEFFGPGFASWKKLLLRGETSVDHAIQAANLLGTIHARSAGNLEAAAQFDTTANFVQLRIDPYLLTTAGRHPSLRAAIQAEAERLASTRICLVHGDFSPKNMMISTERFVLLDCEVAWYGDPAFDVSFLLTHLLLKGLYHAPRQIGLLEMSRAFWQRYIKQAGSSIDTNALEVRVAHLLPMLLLARVDGKSPVDYLTDPKQANFVRQFTCSALTEENVPLDEFLHRWFERTGQLEA
jgi:aminoglycoside phosphotransferase (APT) family kinase protein